MLPILPDTAWLEFRGASAKKGQNKTTHQALVVDAAGREHKCFVKASPDEYPMAFAEGLAWLLAEALDLPRPRFAALLVLPVQKLKLHMDLDQYWMHKQGAAFDRFADVIGDLSQAIAMDPARLINNVAPAGRLRDAWANAFPSKSIPSSRATARN